MEEKEEYLIRKTVFGLNYWYNKFGRWSGVIENAEKLKISDAQEKIYFLRKNSTRHPDQSFFIDTIK